jgi:hypothetical protein
MEGGGPLCPINMDLITRLIDESGGKHSWETWETIIAAGGNENLDALFNFPGHLFSEQQRSFVLDYIRTFPRWALRFQPVVQVGVSLFFFFFCGGWPLPLLSTDAYGQAG